MISVGWDYSTKSSAIVTMKGTSFSVNDSWTRGPAFKNLPGVINRLSRAISTLPNEPFVIGIDWQPMEVYHKTNRQFASVKAFGAGYIWQAIKSETPGHALFISPAAVRSALGVPKNSSKSQVVAAFSEIWVATSGDPIKHLNEHEIDALILAYSLRRIVKGKNTLLKLVV